MKIAVFDDLKKAESKLDFYNKMARHITSPSNFTLVDINKHTTQNKWWFDFSACVEHGGLNKRLIAADEGNLKIIGITLEDMIEQGWIYDYQYCPPMLISEHCEWSKKLGIEELKLVSKDQMKYFFSNIAYHGKIIDLTEIKINQKPKMSVFKMTQKQWADRLFEYGEIRLGSFDYYNNIENDDIRDGYEGSIIAIGQNQDWTSSAVIKDGKDKYIFCSTSPEIGNPTKISQEYDACYEILDIDAFSQVIAKELNAKNHFYAKCVYEDSRAIKFDLPEKYNSEIRGGFNRIISINKEIPDSKYFIKTIKDKLQEEFRVVWTLKSGNLAQESIMINCKEAIKFCRRVF